MQASSPLYSVEENTGVQALTVSTRGAQRGTTGTLQLSTVCARACACAHALHGFCLSLAAALIPLNCMFLS